MPSVSDRLAVAQVTGGGCHELHCDLNSTGYARVRVGGKRKLAHRVAYEHHHGPIPPGQVVRHRCDNRRCVNPQHLELGSHSDNVQDMLKRGRGNPPRGQRNGMSKLSDEQAKEIRSLWPDSGMTQGQIANQFGVSQALVSMICRGRTRTSREEQHD